MAIQITYNSQICQGENIFKSLTINKWLILNDELP